MHYFYSHIFNRIEEKQHSFDINDRHPFFIMMQYDTLKKMTDAILSLLLCETVTCDPIFTDEIRNWDTYDYVILGFPRFSVTLIICYNIWT